MWISKKKLSELEKRVADLEKQFQSQHIVLVSNAIIKDGSLHLYPRGSINKEVKDNNLEGQQNG